MVNGAGIWLLLRKDLRRRGRGRKIAAGKKPPIDADERTVCFCTVVPICAKGKKARPNKMQPQEKGIAHHADSYQIDIPHSHLPFTHNITPVGHYFLLHCQEPRRPIVLRHWRYDTTL